MKEKEFTSDRYYELRHELEDDFHDEYEYSNIVEKYEIQSIECISNKTLRVSSVSPEGEEYHITIKYLDEGKYEPKSVNNVFIGCWFEELPDLKSNCAFDCCVFCSEVNLKEKTTLKFINCFFLDRVLVEECNEGAIDFEYCAFKQYLTIKKCKTDEFIVEICSAPRIFIEDCVVNKSTILDRLYTALDIEDSSFYGREFSLNGLKSEGIIYICGCTFEPRTEISHLSIREMKIKNSTFEELCVYDITTDKYLNYEELVTNYDCDSDYDELTEREKRFSSAMEYATKTGHTISIKNSIFNGTAEFSKIVTSVFTICNCRTYDYVCINDENTENKPLFDFSLPSPPKHEFSNQILILDDTTFYEGADIDNTYRYIRMNNTKFKNEAYLDVEYLHLTEGWLIKKRYADRRLIDDHPESISELYKACNERDFYGKQHLFTAVKTYERDYESLWWKKLEYYTHELFSSYGKSPVRVLSTIIITIMAFTAVFLLAGYGTSIDCLIESCSSFFTIGLGLSAMENNGLKTAVILEGAVGFILMTYFVVVLCDRNKF